jgi:hypothetical protein
MSSFEKILHHDFHSLSLPGKIQASIAKGAASMSATTNSCLRSRTRNPMMANRSKVPPKSHRAIIAAPARGSSKAP